MLVGLEDIAPTVLDVMDLEPFRKADGRSLLDHPGYEIALGESSHCKDEPVLDCAPHGVKGKEYAARSATETLIERPIDGGSITRQVYDRQADPAERTPLERAPARTLPKAIAPLRAARTALDIEVPSSRDDGTASEAVQAERDALKALGYIE